MNKPSSDAYDFVIIGTGFGGSVSAMRLAEKGYSVLALERGRRFRDQDFAKSNWNIFKFLWIPPLRCFGILQISLFKHALIMHGSGVGGGSLVYANVLMQPNDKLFENPSWRHLADWKMLLTPHYETVRRMLGATPNPKLWASDHIITEIAKDLGVDSTFHPTAVGVFFGEPGKEGQTYADPYFDGEGPERQSCTHCGGCIVGCRNNAKNTLVKNYLYFAEKWGAVVLPECEAHDVRPLPAGQADGARYEVVYRSTTSWLVKTEKKVRARNVIFAAGTLGTLKLLFHCRDITCSLPRLSQRLGDVVRTNSEALLGASARNQKTDYSKGIAITSIFEADEVTCIEPVRFPAGSSSLRFLGSPLLDSGKTFLERLGKSLALMLSRPMDTLRLYLLPGWAQRTIILLVMQTEDSRLRLRLERGLRTLFRWGLVTHNDTDQKIPAKIESGHRASRMFAEKIHGFPAGTINEGLLNIPMTAHILGGCPFGRNDQEGVINLDCQIHNYAGLYVVDSSIVPANPGVNPSLTISALAEYAMSCIPPKERDHLDRRQ